MGVPYEIPPISGLQAKGGQANCFPIDFPSRSILNKLIITQIDGLSPVAFTAALYNSLVACQGQNESESVGAIGGILPPDLYRVTPDLAGTGGKLMYFSETQTGGHGFVFFNQDVNVPEIARLGNMRRIYLIVTPAGTANNVFAVALGGEVFA